MQGSAANVSILDCGQRRSAKLRLYLVYSAGDLIEATADKPFFQTGEYKYGRLVLDRMIDKITSFEEAALNADLHQTGL